MDNTVSCPGRTYLGRTIDPFIRVYLDGEVLGETARLKNQPDPTWEQDFFFDVRRDADGYLYGILRLELYNDKGGRADECVCSCEVDLSELPPEASDPYGQQRSECYDYDLAFAPDARGAKLAKQGRSPRLSVALVGAIPSWGALVAGLEGCEEAVGLLADEDSKQLYVPLPGGEGAGLYGGIHYDLPRAVHFKLVTTAKDPSGLHLDFKCSKARCLRVERVVHRRHRRRLLSGLRVSAEATLTGMPLGTDLTRLQLVVTARRAVASVPVPTTLERAGFPSPAAGSAHLSFKRVTKDMIGGGAGGAMLDAAAGAILVPVGKPPHSALLQLGYGEGNSRGEGGGLGALLGGGGQGPCLRVLTVKGQAEGSGKALVHDFAVAAAEGPLTTVSEAHRRPLQVLDGSYAVSRTAELPGAFNDEAPGMYDSAVLVYYNLEPPPEPEPVDDLLEAFRQNPVPQSMGSAVNMVATTGSKVVGRVVGQLGSLVVSGSEGALARVANVTSSIASSNSGRDGASSRVMGALKAPLKLFRGKAADREGERASQDGSGREDRPGSGREGRQGIGRDGGSRDGREGSGRDGPEGSASARSGREREGLVSRYGRERRAPRTDEEDEDEYEEEDEDS
ncbi:hypothetical protein GPECTOR_9g664 [Gonium pectorale]|uniref:C2 domain-containing protein n=1 Tax=Gonium pectorale TaxID=33097 RepID=A0A150GRY1_GONPE|nr:hypothetical protein GPECTOR_9g664 [Gonium pectorale]|eukprot:KXZ52619.1 hypothetical protein GPECTOR_9g664 [Gonium pectorale]